MSIVGQTFTALSHLYVLAFALCRTFIHLTPLCTRSVTSTFCVVVFELMIDHMLHGAQFPPGLSTAHLGAVGSIQLSQSHSRHNLSPSKMWCCFCVYGWSLLVCGSAVWPVCGCCLLSPLFTRHQHQHTTHPQGTHHTTVATKRKPQRPILRIFPCIWCDNIIVIVNELEYILLDNALLCHLDGEV